MTIDDLERALARFARIPLLSGPTPIQRLTRLEEALGAKALGVQLFVKRDDHMEIGGGGNKLRKLEYLLAAARAQDADTVITVGAIQSNHARLTAAAAARIGLACELFLTKTVPRTDGDYERSGNLVLDAIFGARVCILAGGSNALEAAHERALALAGMGRRAHVVPTGGSPRWVPWGMSAAPWRSRGRSKSPVAGSGRSSSPTAATARRPAWPPASS